MIDAAGSHDATFYVQLEPDFYSATGIRNVRAVGMTQKRPATTRGRVGTVTVKLTVRVPDAAFLPLAPEAIVVIPADLTAVNPIEVEAGDPV